MKKILFAALLIAPLAAPMSALAQATEDYEGCKDHKLVSRMPGCFIGECASTDFDEVEIPIAHDKESSELQMKTIEGSKDLLAYDCPQSLTSLKLVRNASNALKKAGFKEVYFAKLHGNTHYATYQKGSTWVTFEAQGDGSDFSHYRQTVAVEKAMDQEMTADADALQEEIEKSGRVAVYGIEFDTGKATVKPESEKVLQEIVTLLENNADWKMTVEGHTDNVGKPATNKKLSEQRAAAVVTWLSKKGIEKKRLTAKGLGDTKPVGDNESEEGRQKNRRVELVKN